MAIEYQNLFEEADRVAKGKAKGVAVFTDILARGIRSGEVPARSATARSWYRNAAKAVTKTGTGSSGVSGSAVISSASKERGRLVSNMEPGDMYTFAYNPKHKATLPYYDRFPLIFPINKVKGGFLGINFHYLPIPLRLKLLDKLVDYSNNTQFDESTKLIVDYRKLKNVKLIKPTIHKYLSGQTQSQFRRIDADEFMIAALLLVQQFKKASSGSVWSDSRGMI